MKRHLAVAAVTGAMILMGANIAVDAAELKVLSAIGMRQIMLDLRPKFERETGHTLAITFDSTGLIVKRIAAGENGNVVIINRSGVQSLEKAGKVIAGSVTNLATSISAVAGRKGPQPNPRCCANIP